MDYASIGSVLNALIDIKGKLWEEQKLVYKMTSWFRPFTKLRQRRLLKRYERQFEDALYDYDCFQEIRLK
ncbi:hypothetical protein [Neorhodopirellula pilleata]|uniref:Uncharacterized protein n=1 Tax=Neorhodopirellula pilleata TaxID=2714738 RepID=A0A5C5ZV54_9BACT|nr:hypothetical protein [Neorhodopirellula pilleata]TWT91395.1 hypothetical protein Pla100_52450 [Neorhodopirellula pilleata]TWT91444.1 hypothetical protein Pla100_52940 [Neorhodopirellula pilleata]